MKIKDQREVIVGVILIVLLVTGGVIHALRHPLDCQKVDTSAAKLLQPNKYKDAYNKLLKDVDSCTQNATPQSIKYSADLTTASYFTSHDSQALQYANQTLSLIAKLSPSQRQKDTHIGSISTSMTAIQSQEELKTMVQSGK